MTNSVRSSRSEKYNIAAFFSGVGGIELGFEQINEFRVVYANKYVRQTYQLNNSNIPSAFFKLDNLYYDHPNKYY
jgi:DNA (cytosine-5)-methyltransferase 1